MNTWHAFTNGSLKSDNQNIIQIHKSNPTVQSDATPCISPNATPGSFWLNGHVAGATDPRGTAGARDGWHVTDITVWGLMGHVVTAPSLLLIKLVERNAQKMKAYII